MPPVSPRLVLVWALATACIRFEEHEIGPCWALPCGACVAMTACAWDTSDNLCRQTNQLPQGHGQHRRPDRCPADPTPPPPDAGRP